MSQSVSDRNLLYGILALQMDFISRDALVSAMHAWVLDKSRSLGHILQEQHALSADEHAVLDTLVEKHLSRHGSDVKQSLAALPAAPAVQRDLSAVADLDVQASLGGITLAAGGDPNLTIPF